FHLGSCAANRRDRDHPQEHPTDLQHPLLPFLPDNQVRAHPASPRAWVQQLLLPDRAGTGARSGPTPHGTVTLPVDPNQDRAVMSDEIEIRRATHADLTAVAALAGELVRM